jgi:hypothetical protein
MSKSAKRAGRPPGRRPRPHIKLPGDTLIPKSELAAELGVAVPTAMERAVEHEVMPMKVAAFDAAIVGRTVDNDEITLAEHAEAIRVLGRRVIGDVIEIGQRLTISKKLCGHGGWLPWLEREFGWSEDSALRFMRVAEFAKNRNLRNLKIPVSGLYLLAAPGTPEMARDEAIERTEAGERLTPAQIKELIDKAVEPQLEALRAEAFQREAELRAEYEGAGQAKIDKAVNKATVPLQKQIQKYEERLAKIKERDEARAAPAKSGADPQPKTGNSADPAQSAAAMAAAHAANEGEGAAEPAEKSKSKSAPKSKPAATSHEITARSACDPEAPEMSDGTEEIELPMQDFDRLAKFKRRTVDPEAVWVCEQLELAWSALRDRGRISRPQT